MSGRHFEPGVGWIVNDPDDTYDEATSPVGWRLPDELQRDWDDLSAADDDWLASLSTDEYNAEMERRFNVQ